MGGRTFLIAGLAVAGGAFALSRSFRATEEIDLAYVERAAAHYARAESELAAADVAALPRDRRVARAAVLDELRAYRTARDFGRNEESDDARVHLFVDRDGRRCAVAQLLHRTGEDDLVAAVAASENGAFVNDLADDPRFRRWLDRVGLTVEEAARIQAPAVPTATISQPAASSTRNTTDATPGTPTTQTGEPGRPSGGTPGGGEPPGGPTTGSGGGTGGPTTGSGGGTGSPGGGPAGRGPRTGATTSSDRPLGSAGADAWWMWWEFEKLNWMRPARDRLEPAPATQGYDAAADVAARSATAVERLLPLLAHKDPAVRGAAAIAAGRLGGATVVDAILPLLEDPKSSVRDRAILALGATGDARAAERLLAIARTTNEREAPTASARQLAVVALGVARRHGLRADPGAEVAELLDRAKAQGDESLADAAAMYVALSRSDAVDRRLEDVANEQDAPGSVRGRALEALPPKSDAATVRVLQKALGSKDTDARRSAAIALGDVRNPLVAPHLMTAAEMETDGLTRGLLVLALSRHGGARAEGFVASALADRDDTLRPWAALGLSVLARDHGSDAARAALASAKLRSTDAGALWLARAVAGDAAVGPECIEALDASEPRLRAHAATALALVPGDAPAAALRARAAEENDDAAGVAIALAIGLRGDPSDTALLLAAARRHRPDWLRAPTAMALGMHRARGTVDGLLDVLQSPRSSAAQLTVAADAIGLALDRVPDPSLPAIGRSTNFAVIPAWLLEALRSTL